MSKRKIDNIEGASQQRKLHQVSPHAKKYSLDSDEEDEQGDEDNILDDDDIEGEEDGVLKNVGQERYTAFNMREELEEGHFDKEGHFIWKNEKEVRDNWLDNIDWQKIEPDKGNLSDEGDDEDSNDSSGPFEEIRVYKEILTYMEPRETISKSLKRLGGKFKNLSSIERLRRKKAGLLNTCTEVTELTALADKILSKTGNMDIYEENYEVIFAKIENYNKKVKNKNSIADVELDMYADDFGTKEKTKLSEAGSSHTQTDGNTTPQNAQSNEVLWEFKWDLKDEKVEGPHTTQQMLKWANEGYFKTGVWARKSGENTSFYSTNRMDFEIYF